ncbi:hypothetical protein J7L67_04185, partial [bacterium]|nr:hypothetical protein [bacterium]
LEIFPILLQQPQNTSNQQKVLSYKIRKDKNKPHNRIIYISMELPLTDGEFPAGLVPRWILKKD